MNTCGPETKVGDVVEFLDRNGYDSEREFFKNRTNSIAGDLWDVVGVEVGGFRTDLTLQRNNFTITANSVMFSPTDYKNKQQ